MFVAPSRWTGLLFLALSLLLVSGCQTTKLRGEAIGEPIVEAEVLPFAKVHDDPEPYFHKTLLVDASVTAVCQRKGCWMQVEDNGRTAMVRWESGCGGKYAFPETAVGKKVVIQGSFYPKTINEEDAEHIASEAAEGVKIAREGYEFNASAVLVRDPA